MNDFDEFDDFEVETPEGELTSLSSEDDVISLLLREQGIEDKNKILYENEFGDPEERSWDSLPIEDKLNIIRNHPETDLDDSEIELLNVIRSSKMTPREYIQYVQNDAISRYQAPELTYSTDQYSDDELFIYDMLSKLGDTNVSDEEAIKELLKAKEDTELYNKKIRAIRNEYKELEDANILQQQLEWQEAAQLRYYQYTQSIANSINDFNEFAGYDLNMDRDDKQEVYEFLTGVDAAGANHFAKALQDPELTTKMAWFILKGEDMMRDVTNYFLRELAQARRLNNSKSVYIPKNINNEESLYDDDFE